MTGKLVDLVLRYFSIPKISVRGKGDRACSCESRPSERPSSKEVRAKVVRAKDLHRACSGERRSFVLGRKALGRKALVRARAKDARPKKEVRGQFFRALEKFVERSSGEWRPCMFMLFVRNKI